MSHHQIIISNNIRLKNIFKKNLGYEIRNSPIKFEQRDLNWTETETWHSMKDRLFFWHFKYLNLF